MKPRLILHIGTHKTATSTLQAVLARRRGKLATQGFCYPSTARAGAVDQNKHTAFARALEEDGAAFAAEYDRLKAEFDASGCQTMVLSAEGLSAPAKPTGNRRVRMRAIAGDFDIEVICFLRRQDYFIESLWNQHCKNGRTIKHIDAFIRQPQMVRHMTYKTMLDDWAIVGTVKALGFEAARETGIVVAFSEATGMTLPTAPKSRNVSPGMGRAALMAALNAADIPHETQQIERALGPDTTRYALGSRLRAGLLTQFAAHNAALQAAYGVGFSDRLPEEPAEPIARAGAAEISHYQLAMAALGFVAPPLQNRRQARRGQSPDLQH